MMVIMARDGPARRGRRLNVHVGRVGPVVFDVHRTRPAVHRRSGRIPGRSAWWFGSGTAAGHRRHGGRMVDAAVVHRMGERHGRRRYVVMMVMVAGRAGARARGTRSARHAWIQPVGQRLLERRHGGRGHGCLTVIQVGGRRCAARARDTAPAGNAARSSRCTGWIWPATVRRPAVQPLERRVVARLG